MGSVRLIPSAYVWVQTEFFVEVKVMPRRGENIYKRKDGRWEGRYIRSYLEDGSAKYGSVYGKTYAETKEKLAIFKVKNKKKPASIYKLTVKELMELWLAERAVRVKGSSYACYAELSEVHICPELGNQNVRDLTSEKLDSFIAGKKEKGRKDGRGGLSAKTIADILFVLKSALKLAQKKYHYVDAEGVMEVKGPTPPKHRVSTFGQQETKRMSKVFLENWNLENASTFLTLNTGIRLGELCGLRWSDIDDRENELHISRTVLRVKNGLKTKLIVQTPKSESSERILPIEPELVQRLLALRGNTEKNLYIFSGTSKPIDPRTVQYRFRKFLTRYDLTVRNYHTLRHSFASRCIEQGMDAKCLSELLGHANIKTTLQLYVHPSMAQKRAFMRQVSTLPGNA